MMRFQVAVSHAGPTKHTLGGWLAHSLWGAGVTAVMDERELSSKELRDVDSIMQAHFAAADIILLVLTPKYFQTHRTLQELEWACASKRRLYPVFNGFQPDIKQQVAMLAYATQLGYGTNGHFPELSANVRHIFEGTELRAESGDREHHLMVQEVVERCVDALRMDPVPPPPLISVGMQDPLTRALMQLHMPANDDVDYAQPRVLALYGPGGAGKTRLAEALYRHLSPHFTYRSFTRFAYNAEYSPINGQVMRAQSQLLQDLANVRDEVQDPTHGAQLLARYLPNHPDSLLIVIDNLGTSQQLEDILPLGLQLPPGSVLITTSRNAGLVMALMQTLPACRVLSQEVVGLVERVEKRELLCRHSLPRMIGWAVFNKADEERLASVVETVSSLPLAIEVVGRHLCLQDASIWEGCAKQLVKFHGASLESQTQRALRLSYAGLDAVQRTMLLDIAAFFLGKPQRLALWVFEAMYPEERDIDARLQDLGRRLLMNISEDGVISMHDAVVDMALSIMKKAEISPATYRIFIEGWRGQTQPLSLNLDLHAPSRLHIQASSLKDKQHLLPPVEQQNAVALLRIHDAAPRGRDPTFGKPTRVASVNAAASALIYLSVELESKDVKDPWNAHGYRRDVGLTGLHGCMPQLNSSNLRVVDLAGFKGPHMWPCLQDVAQLRCLRICTSHGVKHQCSVQCRDWLGEIGASNGIEELTLGSCWGFKQLPSAICLLTGLQRLDLRWCKHMMALPAKITQLKALKGLDISFCKELESATPTTGLVGLKVLNMRGCEALKQLPPGLGQLTNLQRLDLRACTGLKTLPEGLGTLSTLQNILLEGCTALETLPDDFAYLRVQTLSLANCQSLIRLPDTIGQLQTLQAINLGGCKILEELPESSSALTNLQRLDLGNCVGLKRLPKGCGAWTALQELNLNSCRHLGFIPDTFAGLCSLQDLDMSRCTRLLQVPKGIGGLTNLVSLRLSMCDWLMQLPEGVTRLTALQRLHLFWCDQLTHLPEGISALTQLEVLDLTGCGRLECLPPNIGELPSLRRLNLRGCTKLKELPQGLNNLACNRQALESGELSKLSAAIHAICKV